MGRPSVQAQRKEEILDAFESCVARFGIEGATLERIAEISGLARPLIRHHAGNRDDLIDALFERFQSQSSHAAKDLLQDLPAQDASLVLLDRLFDTSGDQTSILLAESFIAHSTFNPDVAEAMSEWVSSYTGLICDVLATDFTKAEPSDIRIVAPGVLGLQLNLTSLAPFLSLKEFSEESKAAAMRLIHTLS